MAISVTCPSCLKRFNVSDKFAGKSGPCPNCQKTIKIPEKQDEIVIHAPDAAAPKDAKGKSILKPIRRREVSLSVPVILAASLGTLVVFGIALGLGLSGEAPAWLLGTSAILLALPLVCVGYWFLHDDELEAFRGRSLWIRCGICSLIFASIWGVYAFVPRYLTGDAEITGVMLASMLPVMVALGAAASVAALELEIAQGVLLYGFYLGTTFVLAWLAGAPLTGPRDLENAKSTISPPPVTRPSQPLPPDPVPQPPKQVPKLLQ